MEKLSEDQQPQADELDDLDHISRVALLIDDLSNEDPNAKLHSIQRLSQIAQLLGPERCTDELIPMLTELIDKIDNNPELMMNLAEQLGKLTDYLGDNSNSSYLLKPLELILSSDDSVVREKAVAALKSIGNKISDETVYKEYMPLVKRMRKGDLCSMRISASFLYAQIYFRLDNERKQYLRLKFEKLAKDDTPMVRRGSAQSISILSDYIEPEIARSYLLPLLKSLLQDDNDSVKITAVNSTLTVVKLVNDTQLIREEIIPPFKVAVENKMASWRLRFSVAEVAASMCEYLDREISDNEISALYENLLQDKEPEVKSEAVNKISTLARFASPTTLTEKLLPIINTNTVNDNSLHVRSSLAISICEIAHYIGKDNSIRLIIPPVVQMLKDQATEVRVNVMSHLQTLTEVIGTQEFDTHVIPSLVALSTDKIWRVKLALIQFIPQLTDFLDKDIFTQKFEPVVLGWLADPVYQIREESINLIVALKEKVYDQSWLENTIESKVKEFAEHQKFAQRIHTLFIIQKIADKVGLNYLNEKLVPYMIKLSDDSVPNIRFNVSKTIELIYPKLSYSNKEKCKDALRKMENEQVDFDVKFYAEKALKTISNY